MDLELSVKHGVLELGLRWICIYDWKRCMSIHTWVIASESSSIN